MLQRVLPDFQQPVRGTERPLYMSYGGTGEPCVLFPEGLELATTPDGMPDFDLTLVRETDPNQPYAYGMLNFRLRPIYRADDALSDLRGVLPGGTLTRCTIGTGYLRFYLVASSTMMPDSLKAPVALGWNGLDTGRWIQKLSADAASLVKQTLLQKEMLLRAWMEAEVVGVSCRLNVRVRFDPSQLLTALQKLSKDGLVGQDAVRDYFSGSPSSLPLSLDALLAGNDLPLFAIAMADRVRVNYAKLVPAPAIDRGICWTLPAVSEISGGTVEWDLSQVVEAPHGISLDFDPIAAVRQLVAAQGLGAAVHEVSVPPLETGAIAVTVSANIPAQRPQVLELGVSIDAAANPPNRMQPIQETLVLTPPKDSAGAVLHFSPLESPAYTCSTFLVLMDSQGVRKLDGQPVKYDGLIVQLSPDQFPVTFVPLEASSTLLALATLHATCTHSENGQPVTSKFDLDSQHPAAAVTIPKGTQDATLQIQAVSPSGQTITFGPVPLANIHLDLWSFPQYGPQTVQIDCTFDPSTKSYAIELVPESQPNAQPALAHFSPETPSRPWTYIAVTPFQPGFRYREYRNPGEPPAPWSEVQLPGFPLHLNVAGVAMGGSA